MNDVGGCHGDGMIDEGVGSACKMAKVESLHIHTQNWWLVSFYNAAAQTIEET